MGCRKCGRCCTYWIFDPWQFKHDEEFMKIQNGIVSGKHWLIPSPCPKLKDGLCEIYDSRPEFCRDWPGKYEECDHEWLKDLGCKIFVED